MNSIGRLVQKCRVLFSDKNLLYTNTGIAIALSSAGDVLQQSYEVVNKQSKGWDKIRTSHVATTGLFVGPFCHYWYIWLDRYLPGKTGRILVKKIIIDQIVCSPIVIGAFLLMTCLLEQKSWNDMKEETKGKGSHLYMMDWIIWPPAQLVNFYFLPTRYRVLYDNTVSFGFDWYYSKVKYSKNS